MLLLLALCKMNRARRMQCVVCNKARKNEKKKKTSFTVIFYVVFKQYSRAYCYANMKENEFWHCD